MKRGGSVSGAVSLVMIFCVLCLVVFATLTLATADRERKLVELTALRAEQYYAADAEATDILAALLRGEEPDTIVVVERTGEARGGGELVRFSVPAGGEQWLQVEASLLPDGGYRILRWAMAYTGEWETNDTIEIWDGDF